TLKYSLICLTPNMYNRLATQTDMGLPTFFTTLWESYLFVAVYHTTAYASWMKTAAITTWAPSDAEGRIDFGRGWDFQQVFCKTQGAILRSGVLNAGKEISTENNFTLGMTALVATQEHIRERLTLRETQGKTFQVKVETFNKTCSRF
ncbi:MAG: hypothetical protein Q9184_006667, partial [Pyrenodesmia sp. 2 TL-2023]